MRDFSPCDDDRDALAEHMRDDQFSQSLEMLDHGCLPDSAVDAEDVLMKLAQDYAYVFPSDSALAMLAGLGPLVEIGAGTGYWAYRLRSIGVDIVAFDQAPVDGERTNRYHSHTRPWTRVEHGDQTVLTGHADRGLFLCWPPLYSSLGDCLTYYGGDTVAYIGDGGYRTAKLDHLREAFTMVATAPVRALDPYPGIRPQLTIWKRTPARMRSIADDSLVIRHRRGSSAMTTAQTRQGTVSGVYAGGVHAFKGIPFGAPPFGSRRMRPPEPPPAWDGVRDCTRYGPTAPKNPYAPPFDKLLAEPAIPGEDCLNLNVWTPELGNAGLPVLVWIHGGSFTNGSGAVPQYDGTAFARDGVVCVTINYRLGADGFLFLSDGVANTGLLDQVAALQWVQENIAGFGGNPARVTIAGESAGGMSVTTLLAMPPAEGLFRRVIAQSGAGQHVLSSATARRVGGYLADKLGVPATRDAIAGVPVHRLLAAQTALSLDLQTNPDPARWGEITANLMVFEPVVDGDVLPAMPLDAIRSGAGRDVDVLIGANTHEWLFFTAPTGVLQYINDAALHATAGAYGLGDTAVELYRPNRPGATTGDVCAAVVTDWFFRVPAIRVAEARGGSPTWMYEFGWRSPVLGGRLGACHYLEVPFAFDMLRSDGAAPMIGSDPPQTLADDMHRAWVDFATSGNPGWPRYQATERATMLFDTHSVVVHDPRGDERQVWDGVR